MGAEPRFADIPDPAAGVADRPAPAAALPTESSLTRAQRGTRRKAVIALSIGWIVLMALRVGVRDDIRAIDVLFQLALLSAVGGLGLFIATRTRGPGLPPPAPVIAAISLAVPALFAAIAVTWSTPEAADVAPVRACFTFTLLVAAGPIALACYFLRGAFLSAPAWRGAAIGAICGLCGAVGVHAHCPASASAHVLLAHGVPIVIAALVGAALGALRGRA